MKFKILIVTSRVTYMNGTSVSVHTQVVEEDTRHDAEQIIKALESQATTPTASTTKIEAVRLYLTK